MPNHEKTGNLRWDVSKRRFHVLLGAAIWISSSALFVLIVEHNRRSEIDNSLSPSFWSAFPDPGFTLFCLSVPALLLAAVLYWWFGRSASGSEYSVSEDSASQLMVPQVERPRAASATVDEQLATYERTASGTPVVRESVIATPIYEPRVGPLGEIAELASVPRRGASPETPKKRYQGVGGWLALFIFGLIVVFPCSVLVEVVRMAEDKDPATTAISALIVAPLACFSIYAGMRLWFIKPNAVQIARRFLLIYLSVNLVAEAVAAILASSSSEWAAPLADAVTSPLPSLVYVGIWYSYLNRSRRVAATYPAAHAHEGR